MANDVTQGYEVISYYLNVRRLADITSATLLRDEISGFSRNPSDKISEDIRMSFLVEVFKKWMAANSETLCPLDRLAITGQLQPGKIFSTHRDFYCRNLIPSARKNGTPPRMSAKYEIGDHILELTLQMHRDHLAPGSPGDLLKGHVTNVFAVGSVNQITRAGSVVRVVASPIFIGTLVDATHRMWPATIGAEVHVDMIDNFAKSADEEFPTSRQLEALRSIPEDKIKHAFGELLNDDAVPKDWAGETSDFFTTHLRIGGVRVSTAFAFKGPAKFHPMSISDLGKNGDQLVRLFGEPAELLVLQHCHYVKTAVRNMMRAFANQIGSRRRYCIIDGCETLRVLRAYGKCGQRSRPRKHRNA